MSPRHGTGLDGIWRIGPVRLLTVVGVGYLAVLTLAAVTADPDAGRSTEPGPPPAVGAAVDPAGSVTPGQVATPPAPDRSRAAPVDPREVRVGSLENRSAPPPAPPPTTRRPGSAPALPPLMVTSYEAESPANGLVDTKIYPCPGCSGQQKVGRIGAGMGTLRFNDVLARAGGPATVTIAYVNGEAPRVGQISVNGGAPITLTFPGTGGWSSVGTMTLTMTLRPGPNTLTMFNPASAAPDFDRITVSVR